MVRGDLGANRDHLVFAHAKFRELHLWLDLGDSETLTLGLRHVLDLGAADAELQSRIAVLFLGLVGHNLTAFQLQDRDRHMFPCVCKDAGHADLLRDNT